MPLPDAASLETLRLQIFRIHPLDDAAWEAMSRVWTVVDVSRKQFITRAGDVGHYLYHVLEGVQRAVYIDDNREATIVFSYPPSFSGVVDSFFSRQPSRYFLEALTQSRFLRMHHHELERLMQEHRSIETFVRVAVTQALAGTLQRQIELLCYSAEEKFTTLLRRSPQVLQLIPHKYLASYIGVDPATFSRLLKTVRI